YQASQTSGYIHVLHPNRRVGFGLLLSMWLLGERLLAPPELVRGRVSELPLESELVPEPGRGRVSERGLVPEHKLRKSCY
ncbi:MAG: hypothetical protein Q8O16_06975, partial [Dehalococcoidia bacterium]|nr:hypothetical protein [Dehalococcoidia bacterium]